MAAHSPPMPAHVETAFHDGPFGRVRSRSVGERRPGLPEVVLVQGMGVSDYLLPGVGALGEWTRAHLVNLPGLAGSGDPPREWDVAQYGRCVADWVRCRIPGPVLLAGHSSGTQVAAHAAVACRDVHGLVLAGPTIDPVARGWLRALARWLWDGSREPAGLTRLHVPEWRRAGLRRLLHLVRIHLADRLEETIARVDAPVLVIRGRRDVIGTAPWARQLASLATKGRYVEVDGAHAFPWRDPHAWSPAINQFARRSRPVG